MATTTNPASALYQQRQLMPKRPLTQFEAYRLAELQANHLLEAAGINEPGTPDELISDHPFLRIQLRHDLPISGLTNWYKPRWLILLNQSEPAVRRRFSLMHEFKHVLDHGLTQTCYPPVFGYSTEDRVEKICDYFAACLLMPKRLIKQRYFQGLHDPAELAGEFGVSETAMRYRLQQLRLLDPTPRCIYPYNLRTELPRGGDRRTIYLRRSQPVKAAA
jgi:hypothetical protein